MKILVNDYAGHPFQIDLSRNLAAKGYNILHVYCSSVQSPRGNIEKEPNDSPNFNVLGLKLSKQINKGAFFERRRLEVEYGNSLVREIERFLPDVLIVSNTPIDAQSIIWKKCEQKNIPIVYWLQDIQSIAIKKIIGSKMPIIGRFLAKYYFEKEKSQLLKSRHIVSISEGFNDVLQSWGIRKESISYIPNWAPINEIPVVYKDNDWSNRYGLSNKKVVLYSGTLGFKHNPDLIRKLSVILQKLENAILVVISEGIGQEYLKKQKEQLNLENLLLLPFQDFKEMSQVMASADVLIAILEKDAGVFSVPSKILTYLCSQRPIVLSVPFDNLSSEIVKGANAGVVVDPDKEELFIEEVIKLLNDESQKKLLGENGRFFAENNFKIERIVSKFEKVIEIVK
jgi:colanic acid biosynthesis glycosyl transferase WcaI